MYTRVHTPRRCGLPLRAAVDVLAELLERPLRTSWLIVGINRLSAMRQAGARRYRRRSPLARIWHNVCSRNYSSRPCQAPLARMLERLSRSRWPTRYPGSPARILRARSKRLIKAQFTGQKQPHVNLATWEISAPPPATCGQEGSVHAHSTRLTVASSAAQESSIPALRSESSMSVSASPSPRAKSNVARMSRRVRRSEVSAPRWVTARL